MFLKYFRRDLLKHRFAHKDTDLTQQAGSGVQHYVEAPDDTVSQIPMKRSCGPKCEINMGEYKLLKLPEGRPTQVVGALRV